MELLIEPARAAAVDVARVRDLPGGSWPADAARRGHATPVARTACACRWRRLAGLETIPWTWFQNRPADPFL